MSLQVPCESMFGRMKASLDDAFLPKILNALVLSRGNHLDRWFETKTDEGKGRHNYNFEIR